MQRLRTGHQRNAGAWCVSSQNLIAMSIASQYVTSVMAVNGPMGLAYLGLCQGLTPLEEEKVGNSGDNFAWNHCKGNGWPEILIVMETNKAIILQEDDT